MFHNPTTHRDKSVRCAMMSAVAQASDHLRAVVLPVRPGESVKALLRRAAQRTGLPHSRTREIWYGRAKRIDAVELQAIQAALPPLSDADSVELCLAYAQSLENRMAAFLDEAVALRLRCEAELAAGANHARHANRAGRAQAADGGSHAAARP